MNTPRHKERIKSFLNPFKRNSRRAYLPGLTALALLIIGAACSIRDGSIRQLPADGADLPILRQVIRAHSHETRAMQVVVRDAAGLAKIPLEDIEVDFSREMLLIITLGAMPSDGYRVRINRVFREGGSLKVDAEILQPAASAGYIPSSPYCIAVVPQCELNVLNFSADVPTRERTWTQSEPGFGPK